MNPQNELKLGIHIQNCTDCEKMNTVIRIYKLFDLSDEARMISYDRFRNEIIVDSEQLMRMIQLINPYQKERKIRLSDVITKDKEVNKH